MEHTSSSGLERELPSREIGFLLALAQGFGVGLLVGELAADGTGLLWPEVLRLVLAILVVLAQLL